MDELVCSCCGIAKIQDPIHIYDRVVDEMCPDCIDICLAAIQAITQTRQDGVPIYGPDTWRQANMEHRLDHAATHITQYQQGARDEDHLAHAICDLVFVYATKD